MYIHYIDLYFISQYIYLYRTGVGVVKFLNWMEVYTRIITKSDEFSFKYLISNDSGKE